MTILVILIPLALALGLSALIAFIYSARSGQMEDLETPAYRALIDESEKEKK